MSNLVGVLRPDYRFATIEGELRCPVFGNVWNVTGAWDPVANTYMMVATPGEVPDDLKIPFLDDDEPV